MLLTGFIYGVVACALWGLVYMIPLWLAAYDPLLIALARYTVFGALSTFLLFFNLQYVRRMTPKVPNQSPYTDPGVTGHSASAFFA